MFESNPSILEEGGITFIDELLSHLPTQDVVSDDCYAEVDVANRIDELRDDCWRLVLPVTFGNTATGKVETDQLKIDFTPGQFSVSAGDLERIIALADGCKLGIWKKQTGEQKIMSSLNNVLWNRFIEVMCGPLGKSFDE
ncbi:hypothetical protein JKY72_03585 [Candidatus Gracilibacteria bacterium]|nr:hypothetical protein [Candidatus Gracilibacteria bacterium]